MLSFEFKVQYSRLEVQGLIQNSALKIGCQLIVVGWWLIT